MHLREKYHQSLSSTSEKYCLKAKVINPTEITKSNTEFYCTSILKVQLESW